MDRKSDQPKAGSEGEIVVFSVVRDSQCTECGAELWKGSLLRLEGEKASARAVRILIVWSFCPPVMQRLHVGRVNTQSSAPSLSAGRVRANAMSGRASWSSQKRFAARKRNHWRTRNAGTATGTIGRAAQDSGSRVRRCICDAIREQYPSCPTTAEKVIAEHACRKYSGRIGRTAAAKELSPEPIRLAVIAHIRHCHTNYDELLAVRGSRHGTRESPEQGLSNPCRLATAWCF